MVFGEESLLFSLLSVKVCEYICTVTGHFMRVVTVYKEAFANPITSMLDHVLSSYGINFLVVKLEDGEIGCIFLFKIAFVV